MCGTMKHFLEVKVSYVDYPSVVILYNSLKKSSRFVRHERLFLNPCCESLMMSFFSRYSTVLYLIMDFINLPTTEVRLIGL